MTRARRTQLLAAALLTLAGSPARAQTPDPARAERLFQEGRSALEAGRYAEACPKLAESQQLDAGTGTLLALALCHDGEGKTASAWRELHEVVEESQRAGRADRVQLARARIAALEPRLSKLAVAVGTPAPGLDVQRDGEPLPPAQWGRVAPVDPGEHVVRAEAPGRKPWRTTVTVGRGGDTIVVTVPALEDAGAQVSAAPGATEPPPLGAPRGPDRTVGWLVGGAGVVALGVGTVFGFAALSEHGSASSQCPSSTCTDAAGVSLENRARTNAWIADAGIGLGLVGVVVGAWLVLRPQAAGAPAATAGFAPTVGRDAAGGSFVMSW